MSSDNQFDFDVVFCIDTGVKMLSQSYFLIEYINSFYDGLRRSLRGGRIEADVRIKIIEYGDYKLGEGAVVDHGFFRVPEESFDLEQVLNNIKFNVVEQQTGHTSGLEALAFAFLSDWRNESKYCRQSVVLFSLNNPSSIEQQRSLEWYPPELPKNLLELRNVWENKDGKNKLRQDAKMLTLFCNVERGKDTWSELERWDKIMIIDTQDVNDYDYDFITETLLIDLI